MAEWNGDEREALQIYLENPVKVRTVLSLLDATRFGASDSPMYISAPNTATLTSTLCRANSLFTTPHDQSTDKLDIYALGVVLFEVFTKRVPTDTIPPNLNSLSTHQEVHHITEYMAASLPSKDGADVIRSVIVEDPQL